MIDAIARALARVGTHGRIGLVVRDVVVAPTGDVALALDLHYRAATPVCCDEPGCYLRFLGARRAEVPAAIRDALGRTRTPAIAIRVSLIHEAGYRHADHTDGVDATLVYPSAHFRPRR